MRPITIVLIVIIIVIALVMGFFMIISNERSKYGGPSLFDMMLRDKEPSGGEESAKKESGKEEFGDEKSGEREPEDEGNSVTVTEKKTADAVPAEDEERFDQ